MKTRTLLLVALAALFTFAGCKKEHFITDKGYRTQVQNDFEARRLQAEGRAEALFSGMDTLSLSEQEALQFLYAYMPYSDLADYNQEFFLKQVRAAFATKERFEWAANVPEEIFRHFVLVHRVNNEDLDTARLYMQEQLAERLKGLSMYEAALEVNHWCHEHVAYRAADSRTSAPLATMRTGLGRCGEESTFTVTAMRAVGIPARQCYTPRWAHCDDNHAWVEVWVDGQWYFLGACEPDAELNMGWFAVPSTRTMMVHSTVFGPYNGREEINYSTSMYSKANMMPNYAPTKKAKITVRHADGTLAQDAKVSFKLYNYTEYYPLATIQTNANGVATLTTGLGDLLIWATDGEHYAYAPMDLRKQDTLTLTLSRQPGEAYVEEFHMVPPVAGEAKVTPTADKKAENDQRLLQEDSMRADYAASFPNAQNWQTYLKPNANLTDAQAWELLQKSEGNYKDVANFLNNHTEKVEGIFLYDYMKSYSDKDLRDVPAANFEAQMVAYNAASGFSAEVFEKGIMPARISNELIRPWRGALAPALSTIKDADGLRQWVMDNIQVDDTGNYYGCPISPVGVLQLRHSDAHSRDIFFVAACRDLNIPAYLDNAAAASDIDDGEMWRTVSFEQQEKAQPTATITLTYKGKEPAKPTYWVHFSLAKYADGDFVTFDFEGDARMDKFPATLPVEPGYYCLSTGVRYPEGDVLSRVEYFEIKEGEQLTKEIVLRPLTPKAAQTVYGIIPPTTEVVEDMATLADYAGDKGMMMLFLGEYREPSKHLIAELREHRDALQQWGGMVYLVAPAAAKAASWDLPNTDCILGTVPSSDSLEAALLEALQIDLNNDYPLVAVVNNKGEILFHSEGYRIGLAEQLLKATKR